MNANPPHGSPPAGEPPAERYIFPRWSNRVPLILGIVANVAFVGVIAFFWYYAPGKYFEAGYTPVQPVEYSHKLHAGTLGMDCRYCHYSVERSSFAAIPPTNVCMNCHKKVKTDSPEIKKVIASFKNDVPIPWVKVHNLPDYVYFNHSAHLNAGVGCSTCHGRIDQMLRVTQKKPLSMGWCLDCHRNPAPYLRDPKDVTNMAWKPKQADLDSSERLVPYVKDPRQVDPVTHQPRIANPPVNCSGCHR